MAIHAKQLATAATALMKIVRGSQITLPAEIHKALRVEKGDYLKAEVVENRLVIEPVSIMSREEAWQQIREAQASVQPTPEQAAKPIAEQEQEIFEVVEELRHGSKQLETKLLEGLNSGEPDDVTPEYLEKLSQEGGEIISRKEKQ